VTDYKPDFYDVLDRADSPEASPEGVRAAKAALRGWFDATHAKDLAAVRALMNEDIVIQIPFSESGSTAEGHYRVYRGIEECVGFWAAAFKAEGESKGMMGTEITPSTDGGIAFVEGRGSLLMANGRTYENRYVMRFSFTGGKVSEAREYDNPIVSAYGFRRKIAGQFYLDSIETAQGW
jgi:ketosteroid isomerase-like protein